VVPTANGTSQAHDAGSLDEFRVPLDVTAQDLACAKRLVVVHQAEEWPTGRFCRNDHTRHPCRLYRWGVNVLLAGRWSEADIAELVGKVKAGELPWA
jgi:hypothetical protein